MKKFILNILLLVLLPTFSWAATPKLFFSDMTDGPVTGWEGSSTKGAAVSVYGINFGSTRGTSYVTVTNSNASTTVDLTSAGDYEEWGAVADPITPTFNGTDQLQRISFYLNSDMGTSGTYQNSTITVTTSEGTSDSINFHARSTGDIFFISSTGNDSYDGTYATYQSGTTGPKATFGSAKQLLSAGDVLYWGGGTWTAADTYGSWMGGSYSLMTFYWPSWENPNGTQGNSITVKAYPGADTVLDGYTNGYNPLKRHGTGNTMNYWTFSNFTTTGGYSFTLSHNGTDDNCRWIGFDMTTNDGGKTIFPINCGSSNTNMTVAGIYWHDAGCTTRGCTPSGGNGYSFSFSGAGNYADFDSTSGDTGHEDVSVLYSEAGYNEDGHAFYIFGHRWSDRINNLTIANCWFHDNSMDGARMGGGDTNGGSGNYGFVETMYFYNNVVSDNNQGVTLGDAASNTGGAGGTFNIYNNTIIDNSGGCFGFECGSDVACNFNLYNNICYDTTRYINGDECSNGENNPNATCAGSNNLAYGSVDYFGYFTSTQTGDPLLSGFIPGTGSPAYNNGTNSVSGTVTDDARGISYSGETYDIGAYSDGDGGGSTGGSAQGVVFSGVTLE